MKSNFSNNHININITKKESLFLLQNTLQNFMKKTLLRNAQQEFDERERVLTNCMRNGFLAEFYKKEKKKKKQQQKLMLLTMK